MTRYVSGKSMLGLCGTYVIVLPDDLDSALAAKAAYGRVVDRAAAAQTLGQLKAAIEGLPYDLVYDVDTFLFEAELDPIRWSYPEFRAGLRFDPTARMLTCNPDHELVDLDGSFDWDDRDAFRVGRDLVGACIERIGVHPDAGVRLGSSVGIADTALCYRAMIGIPEVHPFMSLATHDSAAGFSRLDEATAALVALSHTVERDDERIARACG